MDKLTLDRIKLLHPAVRKEAFELYISANNKLLGKNVRLRFAYTLRTIAEQDALYAQGRTRLYDAAGKKLEKVTNARGGESVHNYGLAFDIVLLIDKNNDGIFETASWDLLLDRDNDGKADWAEIVNHFKSHGWAWGGDWKKFPDYPHFEKTFGHKWKSLKTLFMNGQTFTESIDGKIYTWVKL